MPPLKLVLVEATRSNFFNSIYSFSKQSIPSRLKLSFKVSDRNLNIFDKNIK